ncbi:Splicing factor 3B subunit 1 [Morella rubra]|uniref:Splicing factor 3B subunit 1 n=1 Tax=Morella rubra TaxID=262757 RepID=A0A6A1VKK8_9ROSI|nr:Splicing factor 3B subunit 1 [Morella rubra]
MESMKGIVIAYVIQIGLCTGTSGVSILPLVLVPQINPWPTAASITLLDFSARQTAASAVKHMALGVAGLGCEDALVHLLNYVWPNIFETSPHVINAVMEAIEGMRVALGAAVVLNYCLQGLFHPARKVREVYWKIYNSLYIGSQDALVAAYPVLEDEHNNIYSRPELMMFV